MDTNDKTPETTGKLYVDIEVHDGIEKRKCSFGDEPLNALPLQTDQDGVVSIPTDLQSGEVIYIRPKRRKKRK